MPDKFPYAIPRTYTPKAALITDYPNDVTGCKNIVIVHASMQGNSAEPLLGAISEEKKLDGYKLRGLATVVPDTVTDDELNHLYAAGVRGARLHRMAWEAKSRPSSEPLIKEVDALAKRLSQDSRHEWIVDVFCDFRTWVDLAPTVRAYPKIKFVADHFGGTFPGEEKLEEFGKFLDLVKEKRLWVKLSGFERLYNGIPEGIDSLTPLAKAIIEAGPTQIIFGSDWPHTQLGKGRTGMTEKQRLETVEGFREVPNAAHIQKLREWITDDTTWQKFWVENPSLLFA
ncbi:hypothetical protein NA57DRAFT_74308 [Rhizodiscina lignyota]|uniref:Amidohydrolase-related domain-containing protein n=1 Tax=Rhizodiscina lignyota TaxID=1504668 RepID=A0A9P4IK45_9PEZI|nr:hypothetical protein NA57DRAFT_74308 [Rhizodiscina lignyota]